MTKTFVRFQDVKEAVTIVDVLTHYDAFEPLKKKPDGYRGPCPFCESSRGFHASTSKNAWHCFGWDLGGNVLDFVASKQNVSIPHAATLLAEWFGIQSETPDKPAPKKEPRAPIEEAEAPDEEPAAPTAANKPLGFALKHLQADHEAIPAGIGMRPETAAFFEGGFCSKGIMAGCVAFPLHNDAGELVGYIGWDPETESYRFPDPDRLNPELEVYNLHRLEPPGPVVVVSDYLDVWRLRELGIRNAIALPSSELSPQQRRALEKSFPARLSIVDRPLGFGPQLGAELLRTFFVKVYATSVDVVEAHSLPS